MATGVITDIHGNTIALDAVLADAASVGVDAWFVLGDLVAVGPDPVGVADRLRSLPNATFVRGNTERYLTRSDFGGHGFPWTREQLGDDRLSWLASMPKHARHGSTLLVHASPGRDDGPGLPPALTDDDVDVLVRGCEASLVLVGHTHQRVDRVVGGVRVVNPGSVGNPVEADLCAGWALIDGGDVELRRVAYDREAAIALGDVTGYPSPASFVPHLRGEKILRWQRRADFDPLEWEPPLEEKAR